MTSVVMKQAGLFIEDCAPLILVSFKKNPSRRLISARGVL
jgi:hypothetical protein